MVVVIVAIRLEQGTLATGGLDFAGETDSAERIEDPVHGLQRGAGDRRAHPPQNHLSGKMLAVCERLEHPQAGRRHPETGIAELPRARELLGMRDRVSASSGGFSGGRLAGMHHPFSLPHFFESLKRAKGMCPARIRPAEMRSELVGVVVFWDEQLMPSELTVQRHGFDQFLVGSLTDHATVIQHHDHIRIHHR